ncbi:MAG: flagellar protein FlaG [Thermodesulfobacteriota bacterium]|nr:flagellar protein FlaG [Thermodesulfobacteriota bacterium]
MLLERVTKSLKSPNSIPPLNIALQDTAYPKEKSKAEDEKKAAELSQISEMAVDLQNKMQVLHNVDLNFSVHEASGKIMVTVVNEDTGKVIREIPSAEMLNLAAKLEEAIGLLFDKKV